MGSLSKVQGLDRRGNINRTFLDGKETKRYYGEGWIKGLH